MFFDDAGAHGHRRDRHFDAERVIGIADSDVERIASHAEATFWLVLPSLPMFLLLPAMLRNGMGFYLALALNVVLTSLLYFGMVKIGAAFGMKF